MTPSPLDVLRDAIQTYIDDVVPDPEFIEERGWWTALTDVEKLLEAAKNIPTDINLMAFADLEKALRPFTES